jgi:hypothetical protein
MMPDVWTSDARSLDCCTCAARRLVSRPISAANCERIASTRALPPPPDSLRRAASRLLWASLITGWAHPVTYARMAAVTATLIECDVRLLAVAS